MDEQEKQGQNLDPAPEEPFAARQDEDDGAFVIGRGFTVDQSSEETDAKKKKRRGRHKKGRSIVKNIIWVLAIVIISVGIAFGVIYVGADYLGIGFGRGSNSVIEIDPGTPTVGIAEKLQEAGAVHCPLVFRLYSKLKGYDSQYKYGVYTFNNDAGYEALAEMLMTDGAKAESVTVTIPEMATVDDIAALLEENGVCSAYDFKDAVQNASFAYDFIDGIPSDRVHYRLEGYLFPETYDFYSYDSEECAYLAVDKMLATFNARLDDGLRGLADASDYTLHELVTMASLIESEAGNAGDEDRARVAAVFYNRLEGVNWDGPKFLQTDPSTKYPYGGGRYNTYETEGLPPGPIGSPSTRSIRAALSPDRTCTDTYFVTDVNGEFYFNETLDAHNRIIADLKAQGLWLYTTLG